MSDIPADIMKMAWDHFQKTFFSQDIDTTTCIALAILAERERHGWQSIETAPKDKTPIIIAVPTKDQDDFIVGEAYFDPGMSSDDGDWWWAGTSYGDYHAGPVSELNHHAPTLWQHLPSPPKP